MANSNFVVQNGLSVGNTTIFAGNGDVITSGNISVTGGGSLGGLNPASIYNGNSNVTVNSGNITIGVNGNQVWTVNPTAVTISGNVNIPTQLTSTTYTSNTGTLSVGGNINYGPDYGLVASFVANIPNYAYVAVQNLNTGGNASASFTAYNNTGTSYLDMGVNSSNFNAVSSGYVNNSMNQPNASFAYSYGGDMVVGTWNNNGIHFITNATTTVGDSMLIAGNGNVYISGNLTVSGNTAFTYTTTNFVTASANVVQTAYLSGNASTNSGTITQQNTMVPSGTINLGSGSAYYSNAYATNIYGTLQTAAQTNITSVGTLTGLTVAGTGTVTTVIASTLNAATIGNSGAVLTGTLSTAAQPNVTTLAGLTGFGTSGVTTTAAGNFTITGSLTVNGTTTTINNTTYETTEYVTTINATNVNAATIGNTGAVHTGSTGTFTTSVTTPTVTATTVNAATIGNASAVLYGTLNSSSASQPNITTLAGVTSIGASGSTTLTGTLQTAAQTNVTSVGTLTSLTVSGALSAGSFTVPTAAQPNITSVGTLTSLSVSGALSAGSFTVPTASQPNITSVGTLTGLTVSGTIAASTNNTINIGTSGTTFATVYATTFSGVSTTAKYADLAENYQADKQYNPGTVLMFGGAAEVTIADANTTAVAGVVSTNPAHLMNGALNGSNVVPLALMGRVPCSVIGPVSKGDLMVSAGFGYAKANNSAGIGQIIGKALADFPLNAKGVIEVVVGRV